MAAITVDQFKCECHEACAEAAESYLNEIYDIERSRIEQYALWIREVLFIADSALPADEKQVFMENIRSYGLRLR